MTAKAGEKAQKTGDFYCASCDEKVHVMQGDTIPECPEWPQELQDAAP
jgi:competence CoiA-like predicted nuclease